MFKLQSEETRARFLAYMVQNKKREEKVLDLTLGDVKSIQANLSKLYLEEYQALTIVQKAGLVAEITKLQKIINLKHQVHRNLPLYMLDKRPLTNIEVMVALMDIAGINNIKPQRPDEQY